MAPLRNSYPVAILRSLVLAPLFVLGCLATTYTHLIFFYVFKGYPNQIQTVINLTKTHFVILLTFITSFISSSKVTITYDPTNLPPSNSFHVDALGRLTAQLTPNSVWISNHQIYTDWLYLWWLTYASRLSDYIHIVLKDGLAKIPVLGYGMTNFRFLFLSRKWEKDKVNLSNQLLEMDANARGLGPANGVQIVASDTTSGIRHWPQGENPNKIWPYVLILYPEGTVPSIRTRKNSREYTEKKNLPPINHVLLPRVRGLFLTLRRLRSTVEVVYDITTGYGGLGPDDIGEEIYSLKRSYLLGIGPSSVNFHIRAWKLSEIPLGQDTEDIDDASAEDLQKFEDWLLKVWYDKDKLMANFYNTGRFVEQDSGASQMVTADFGLRSQFEIFLPFVTTLTSILLLRLAWNFLIKFF